MSFVSATPWLLLLRDGALLALLLMLLVDGFLSGDSTNIFGTKVSEAGLPLVASLAMDAFTFLLSSSSFAFSLSVSSVFSVDIFPLLPLMLCFVGFVIVLVGFALRCGGGGGGGATLLTGSPRFRSKFNFQKTRPRSIATGTGPYVRESVCKSSHCNSERSLKMVAQIIYLDIDYTKLGL